MLEPRSLQATYTLPGLTPGQPSLSASHIYTLPGLTPGQPSLSASYTHCLVLHLANSRSLQATYTLHGLTPGQPSLSMSYIHTAWSYTWPTLALCKPHTHYLVLHLANPRSLQATYTLPGLTPGQPSLSASYIHTHCLVLHLANPRSLRATYTLSGLTPGQPSLSASYIHTAWSYTWPTLALCEVHTHCLVLHLANLRSLQATYTLPGLTLGQLLSSIIFVFVRKLHLTLSFME